MLETISILRTWLTARVDSERGATMVEYGLLIALIAIAVVGAATLLGTGISGLFTRATAAL